LLDLVIPVLDQTPEEKLDSTLKIHNVQLTSSNTCE
jgi:hypothetical protein